MSELYGLYCFFRFMRKIEIIDVASSRVSVIYIDA